MAVEATPSIGVTPVTQNIEKRIEQAQDKAIAARAESTGIPAEALKSALKEQTETLKDMNRNTAAAILAVGEKQAEQFERALERLDAPGRLQYIIDELGKYDVAVREIAARNLEGMTTLQVELEAFKQSVAKYGTYRAKGVNDDEFISITDDLFLNVKQFALQLAALTVAMGFDYDEFNGGLGTPFALGDVAKYPELQKFLKVPDVFELSNAGKNTFTYAVDNILAVEEYDASGVVTAKRVRLASDLTLSLLFPAANYTVTAPTVDSKSGQSVVTVTLKPSAGNARITAYKGARSIVVKDLEAMLHAAATNVATNYHSVAGGLVALFGKTVGSWIKGEKAMALLNSVKGLLK